MPAVQSAPVPRQVGFAWQVPFRHCPVPLQAEPFAALAQAPPWHTVQGLLPHADPFATLTQAPPWQIWQAELPHEPPFAPATQTPGLHFFLPCFRLHFPGWQTWQAGHAAGQLPDFAASLSPRSRFPTELPNAIPVRILVNVRREEAPLMARARRSNRSLSTSSAFLMSAA